MNKEKLFPALLHTVLFSYLNTLSLCINLRTCFIDQAEFVLIHMVLYWPNFSLMFLIHLFLYAGVYCTPNLSWVPEAL